MASSEFHSMGENGSTREVFSFSYYRSSTCLTFVDKGNPVKVDSGRRDGFYSNFFRSDLEANFVRLLNTLPISDTEGYIVDSPPSEQSFIRPESSRILLHPVRLIFLYRFANCAPFPLSIFPECSLESLSKLLCTSSNANIPVDITGSKWVFHTEESTSDNDRGVDENGEEKINRYCVHLPSKSSCSVTSIGTPLCLDAGIPWVIDHPKGRRVGLLKMTPNIKSSVSMRPSSPYFNFEKPSFIGFLTQPTKLSARQMYSICVRGSTKFSVAGTDIRSLVLAVIVLESHLLREGFDPAHMFSHGSQDVCISGQSYKIYSQSELLSNTGISAHLLDSKNADSETKSAQKSPECTLEHQLDLCFTETGHFSIFVFWREIMKTHSLDISADDSLRSRENNGISLRDENSPLSTPTIVRTASPSQGVAGDENPIDCPWYCSSTPLTVEIHIEHGA